MTELTFESTLAPAPPVVLKRPRILFLLNGFPSYGGAETAVACLVRGLQARGADIHLASLLGPGSLPELAELPPGRVAVFDMGSGGYRNINELARLYRYMRRMEFDVVHTHLEFANTIGVPIAKLAGVPVILPTAHSLRPERTRRRLWANRQLARLATRWVTVSGAISEHLKTVEGLPEEVLLTAPNAIDPSRLPNPNRVDRRILRSELGLPLRGPLLAHVGSLRSEKRQKDLIRAFASVVVSHPTARLLIVGTGPLRAELGVLADQLGVGARVEFLGFRSDAPKILAAADVSVLSSIREGLPVVVLESFAVGTPVVATRVGGVGDLLQDGRTGVLVRPRQVDELANSLIDLLNDPVHQASLVSAARQFVLEHFSVDAVSTAFLDLCQGLLDESQGRQLERTS